VRRLRRSCVSPLPLSAKTLTFANWNKKTQVFCSTFCVALKRRCAAVIVRGTFATLVQLVTFFLFRALGSPFAHPWRLRAPFGASFGWLWAPLGVTLVFVWVVVVNFGSNFEFFWVQFALLGVRGHRLGHPMGLIQVPWNHWALSGSLPGRLWASIGWLGYTFSSWSENYDALWLKNRFELDVNIRMPFQKQWFLPNVRETWSQIPSQNGSPSSFPGSGGFRLDFLISRVLSHVPDVISNPQSEIHIVEKLGINFVQYLHRAQVTVVSETIKFWQVWMFLQTTIPILFLNSGKYGCSSKNTPRLYDNIFIHMDATQTVPILQL
jgi:hypothetical protein